MYVKVFESRGNKIIIVGPPFCVRVDGDEFIQKLRKKNVFIRRKFLYYRHLDLLCKLNSEFDFIRLWICFI